MSVNNVKIMHVRMENKKEDTTLNSIDGIFDTDESTSSFLQVKTEMIIPDDVPVKLEAYSIPDMKNAINVKKQIILAMSEEIAELENKSVKTSMTLSTQQMNQLCPRTY